MNKIIEQIIANGWIVIINDSARTGHVEKDSVSRCLIRVTDLQNPERFYDRVCTWEERSMTLALDTMLSKIENYYNTTKPK